MKTESFHLVQASRVPKLIAGTLDAKAAKIQGDLDEAARLRADPRATPFSIWGSITVSGRTLLRDRVMGTIEQMEGSCAPMHLK